MQKIKSVLCKSLLGGALLGVACAAFSATILVTEEEAKLPRAPMGERRGFFRGPEVQILSPHAGEVTKGPFVLKVRFTALGGARIDPDSLEVKYMVEPNKNITSRVKKFLQGDILEIPDAVIPPGQHQLVVRVFDSSGHASAPRQINLDIPK